MRVSQMIWLLEGPDKPDLLWSVRNPNSNFRGQNCVKLFIEAIVSQTRATSRNEQRGSLICQKEEENSSAE